MKDSLTVVKDTTGDLIQFLTKLRAVPTDLVSEVGVEWMNLVRRGFTTNTDPYGVPWKAVKGPDDDTLVDKFTTTKTPISVTVGIVDKIASYHQYGTKPYVILPRNKKALWWPGLAHPVSRVNHPGLPRRMILPEPSEGLPKEYRDKILNAFFRMVTKGTKK